MTTHQLDDPRNTDGVNPVTVDCYCDHGEDHGPLPATTIKRTHELEAGDILANDGAEVVDVARVVDHDVHYAVILRWERGGTNYKAARIESIGMTWEIKK